MSAHADLLAAILKDTAVNKPLVLNEVGLNLSLCFLRYLTVVAEKRSCSRQIRLVTEMFYHLVANAQSLLVQKLQQNAMRFHHALLNLFVTLTSREISWNQGRFSYQVLLTFFFQCSSIDGLVASKTLVLLPTRWRNLVARQSLWCMKSTET